MNMAFLDLDKVITAKLNKIPYEYMVVEDFIKRQHIDMLYREFPKVIGRGSFSKHSLALSPSFASFLNEIEGIELKTLLAKKFSMDLSHRPAMSTIRGYTGPQDGKIHIDSKGKLVTLLIYMNRDWNEYEDGNLRILNSSEDIDNYAEEVPARAGTLLVFKCTSDAWHGHKSFSGPRKAIQTNYVVNYQYLFKEQLRHRASSLIKKIKTIIAPA